MAHQEKRSFKRYESQAVCHIKLGADIFNGKVKDYSAAGMCSIVENGLGLSVGTRVLITFLDAEIEFEGEVAWTKELLGTDVKIGFRRLSEIKGSLNNFLLADTLIGLQRSTKTGILEIKSGSTVKQVFINNGDVIFASSSHEDDRLGELLLMEGKITYEEYDHSSYLLLKTGERLGKILVTIGCVTPKELFLAVRRQITEIIMSLFSMEEGSFEFQEKSTLPEEVITLHMSVANMIFKGIKRISTFAYIHRLCPPIDSVLNLSPIPMNIFQDLDLEPADKKILSYINGFYSIKTILSLSPIKNFDTLKTLLALLSVGLINVKREDEEPVKIPVENLFGEPGEAVPHEFVDKVESKYKTCETAGYYEILGVEKNASIEEIKKSYYEMSKAFHPDRHFSFPDHDLKGKLMKIISYTTEAYETLSHPAKRMEYNLALSLKASDSAKKMEEVTPAEEIEVARLPQGEEEIVYVEETEGQRGFVGIEESAPADEFVGLVEEAIDEGETAPLREERAAPAIMMKNAKEREELSETAEIRTTGEGGVITARRQAKRLRIYKPVAIMLGVLVMLASYGAYKLFFYKSPELQLQPVKDVVLPLPSFREELFRNVLAEAPEADLSLPSFRNDFFMETPGKIPGQE